MKRRCSRTTRTAGKIRATAADVFCGAGGLTRGLLDAGIFVAAGFDVDTACQFPYEHNNPGAEFKKISVTDLTGKLLKTCYPAGQGARARSCFLPSGFLISPTDLASSFHRQTSPNLFRFESDRVARITATCVRGAVRATLGRGPCARGI